MLMVQFPNPLMLQHSLIGKLKTNRFQKLSEVIDKDPFFHISSFKEAKPAWEKLATLYGKVDEEKGFQIEDDLLLLDPNNFDTIQDYVNKGIESTT